MAEFLVLCFFVSWTALLIAFIRRADARLRFCTEFRAAALLLEMRRNG